MGLVTYSEMKHDKFRDHMIEHVQLILLCEIFLNLTIFLRGNVLPLYY